MKIQKKSIPNDFESGQYLLENSNHAAATSAKTVEKYVP